MGTGVELNGARHAFAVDLAEGALPAGMPRTSGNLNSTKLETLPVSGVHLLHGNMLDANISAATVLYMNPACLSCPTKRQLLHKVLEECPRLQFILTTSPLPGLLTSGRFVEMSTITLSPMIGYEWQVPVTLYGRSGGAQVAKQSLRR